MLPRWTGLHRIFSPYFELLRIDSQKQTWEVCQIIKEKKKKPFDSKQIFATFTLGHNVISENIWPQMKVKHLNNLKKSSGKYWQKECRLGKTEQRKKHKMKIKA